MRCEYGSEASPYLRLYFKPSDRVEMPRHLATYKGGAWGEFKEVNLRVTLGVTGVQLATGVDAR